MYLNRASTDSMPTWVEVEAAKSIDIDMIIRVEKICVTVLTLGFPSFKLSG